MADNTPRSRWPQVELSKQCANTFILTQPIWTPKLSFLPDSNRPAALLFMRLVTGNSGHHSLWCCPKVISFLSRKGEETMQSKLHRIFSVLGELLLAASSFAQNFNFVSIDVPCSS